MAADSRDIRTEIGGFFTLIGTPGIIISIGNKKQYRDGDTVVTMTDTASGREMETGLFEMSLFRNPTGTLQVRVGKLMPVPDEKMKAVANGAASEFSSGNENVLVQKPGIYVLAFEPKETAGSGSRMYIIMTRRGFFTASIDNTTETEREHYDRTFASAMQMEGNGNETGNAGAGNPEKNLKIAEETLAEARMTMDETDKEISGLKSRIRELESTAEAAEKAYEEEKKQFELKWQKGRNDLARDYSEKKRLVEQNTSLLDIHKQRLSLCGFFDFALKKELRAEIQNCENELNAQKQDLKKMAENLEACEPEWEALEKIRKQSYEPKDEQDMAERRMKQLEKLRKYAQKQLAETAKLAEEIRNGLYRGPSLETVTASSPARLQANLLESVLKQAGKFLSLDKIKQSNDVLQQVPNYRLNQILEKILIPGGRVKQFREEDSTEILYGVKGAREPIPLSNREAWKNKIYMAMLTKRRALTPLEIQKLDPDLQDISVPMISSLLKVLIQEGLVQKTDSFSNYYIVT